MLEHEPQQSQTTLPTIPVLYNEEREAVERALTPVQASALDSEAYVAPLLANLRKIKSLRHLTDEQLRSEAHTLEIFELLHSSLMQNSEMHWREKIIAAWALSRARLDESQRNRVVARLYDIVGKYGEAGSASWIGRSLNAGVRVGKWVLPLSIIGGVMMLVSLMRTTSPDLYRYPSLPGIVMVLFGLVVSLGALLTPFVVPYSLMVDADHYHEVRAAAVRALRTLGGVESVDLVAKMALESSPMTSGPARGTLAVLLSKLTPQHYGTLPGSLVPDLCRILKYEAAWLASAENHTLALRVTAALEKIGDGHAAVVVEKLLKSSVTPQLRAVLLSALPILQQRRINENAREMLLRHAAMPLASAEQLLRPAIETPSQSDPATLVRAADAPADTDQTP